MIQPSVQPLIYDVSVPGLTYDVSRPALVYDVSIPKMPDFTLPPGYWCPEPNSWLPPLK